MPPAHLIDCHRCVHYYVTWQKGHPHGCKAMGFKSNRMPSLVVFDNSGTRCLKYEPKPTMKQKREHMP